MARQIWLSYIFLIGGSLIALWLTERSVVMPSWQMLLIIWLLMSAFSYLVARNLMKPVRKLREQAERLGNGDLSLRIATRSDNRELDRLAITLNSMARQLSDRIEIITRKRNESDAILDSMMEGVLAIGLDERVLMMNKAMEKILGVSASTSRGRIIQEIVRVAAFQRYITEILAADLEHLQSSPKGDMVDGPGNLIFRWRFTPLLDENQRHMGFLFLVEDVTRLRNLERLQKEFVANVSHELRTPVAGIKGYAETLLDGVLEEPENARRFVNIIFRQAGRLNSLIEDLLSLTWLENPKDFNREDINVADILAETREVCSKTASERRGELSIECSADLHASLNGRLMEQALVNLIENALRYSGESPIVVVRGEADGDHLVLTVQDNGPGIAPEHHARLFERFYRIDQARSRVLGGTGLGLSIVKHITELHGGRVSVTSRPRRGTTFTIRVPDAILTRSSLVPTKTPMTDNPTSP